MLRSWLAHEVKGGDIGDREEKWATHKINDLCYETVLSDNLARKKTTACAIVVSLRPLNATTHLSITSL